GHNRKLPASPTRRASDLVIENLSALRGGKAVAGIGDAGRQESAERKVEISDPGYSKNKAETARVSESPSSYKTEQPRADLDPARDRKSTRLNSSHRTTPY